MRKYVTLKTSFIPDNLPVSKNKEKHCKALVRLRISAHSLASERGRNTPPPCQLRTEHVKTAWEILKMSTTSSENAKYAV